MSKNELTGDINPKNWVQKSDPLVLMRSVPFNLGELKILDTYISRINAADDTKRTVIFTKSEYEKLMGLSCANYRALAKNTDNLLGKVVTLKMNDNQLLQFVLFSKAYYHKDENGKSIIELTCTEEAKDLFFCVGKYRYLKYTLENIIKLTRKASYLLYLYLKHNQFKKQWNISLDELRDNILDCKLQTSYREFKIFKNRVLDPAVQEVNEKTDCKFAYSPIKHGRSVATIKFEIEEPVLLINAAEQEPAEEEPKTTKEIIINRIAEVYNISDPEQQEQIYNKSLNTLEIIQNVENKKIDNPTGYLIKIIDTECLKYLEKLKEKDDNKASYDLDKFEKMYRSPEYLDYLIRSISNDNEQ